MITCTVSSFITVKKVYCLCNVCNHNKSHHEDIYIYIINIHRNLMMSCHHNTVLAWFIANIMCVSAIYANRHMAFEYFYGHEQH